MNLFERIWEFLGVFFGSVTRGVERGITSLVGSSNERYLKKLQGKVDAINALEGKYQAMDDETLKQQTELFRRRLSEGETLDDLMIEAFAVCREAGRRFLSMRHYDVQLMGGMVLHSGSIAEMITGEGKTLVATLPAYLNALPQRGVHVVTVNDYLARRDMEWMAPLYLGLGLTVGAIQNDMDPKDRQIAYSRDITYGTNNEFGFDYLRDNMRPAARDDERYARQYQQVQGPLAFAIIDEVDNILIDEARTPLIISGPAHDNIRRYGDADQIARKLKKGEHFEVNEKDHTAGLTDAGVREAEKLAGVETFYTAGNMDWPHLIDNSLKAHYLYKRDVNYVVKEGSVIIVDEFTGRLMEGRQWSDGLHQAVEAKEGVKIKEQTQTLATITLQNFFKLYDRICGMTGTAMTEADEFWKIYHLDVIEIRPNRGLQRKEFDDVIFCTEKEKYQAIADEIEQIHKWDTVRLKKEDAIGLIVKENQETIDFKPRGSNQTEQISQSQIVELQRKGRPVLVGTTSIEKSEHLANLLDKRGIKHEVLNAKHHKREAEIVAQAGREAAVTIATNMAGRGTDIILGGNPETMAWAVLQDKYETRLDVPRNEWDQLVGEIQSRENMHVEGEHVREIGGLHVIGTERHESRRIDLQLRGRCGRQGDPGSSRFYLSLRDDLMRIFAGDWAEKFLKSRWVGWQEGDRIEMPMVTRRISGAQKKVEERNFEIRKNLLEYDEVMDEQRKRVYSYRQAILEGANCKDLILKMVDEQVAKNLAVFLQPNYCAEMFAAWASNRLSTELDYRDYRGVDLETADRVAREEAERAAETQVLDAVEENLPEDADSGEWNWNSLANFANVRWGLKLRDRDLKQVGRDDVTQHLIDVARSSIAKVDLTEGTRYLDADFPVLTIQAWVHHKFGIEMTLEELRSKENKQLVQLVQDRARQGYDEREAMYPVMAGMYRFQQSSQHGPRLDREAIANWAQTRFQADVTFDELKNKQRDEIGNILLQYSRKNQQRANELISDVHHRIDELFGDNQDVQSLAGNVSNNGALGSLSDWLQQTLQMTTSSEDLAQMSRGELEKEALQAIEDRYRPEIRRMERQLVLQMVDGGWKDHLLAMDHLRSAVGLVGYAQVDPKVEYKREGRKFFEQMWDSIEERTTDLVFRMEQLDESFVGSTWTETAAVHEQAPTTSQIAQDQQQAIEGSQGEVKVETIRNRGDKVGRNDPCPCGSGKKYKNCCIRGRAAG